MQEDSEALLLCLSLPSSLQAVLTLFKLLHVTHLGDNQGGEGKGRRGELHHTAKAQCHGNRDGRGWRVVEEGGEKGVGGVRCIACCLMTVELFKIEAAAVAEYSESIFRLGLMPLTLAAEALLGFCVRVCVCVNASGRGSIWRTRSRSTQREGRCSATIRDKLFILVMPATLAAVLQLRTITSNSGCTWIFFFFLSDLSFFILKKKKKRNLFLLFSDSASVDLQLIQ